MYHSFLIHSSADGHLGCFHVLAIVNSAAIRITYLKWEVDLLNSLFNTAVKSCDIQISYYARFCISGLSPNLCCAPHSSHVAFWLDC